LSTVRNHPPRFFQIGGLTLHVQAVNMDHDLVFHPKLDIFQVPCPSSDLIKIRHHAGLPDLSEQPPANLHYRSAPWEVYSQEHGWLYRGYVGEGEHLKIFMLAKFDFKHRNCDFYHADASLLRQGNFDSLTLFPTDQILLARLFPPRGGLFMHACGMVLNGQGLAFVGHSEAGKTTMARMLVEKGHLLCDDRIILRRWLEGFRLHGTWSHGDIPLVSPKSAPLRAVLLLEQAPENQLVRLQPPEAVRLLPQFVIRPLVTRAWWEQVLDIIGILAREVPLYRLRFDKSGRVWEVLQELL
jgi:hypothetical protein